MKYGVCSWVLPMKEIESLKYAKEIGLDGVSIQLTYKGEFSLATQEERELYLEKAAEYGIEIPTLALNVLCQYGMSKASHYDFVLKIMHQAVETAKYMGIKTLQVPSFLDGAIHNEEEYRQTIKCLKYLCEISEKAGIRVGYENALTEEQNKELIELMPKESYFVFFDTQNPVRCSNSNPYQLLEALIPYVKQIHLKDSFDDRNRPLQLGEGNTFLNECLEVIKKHHYDGWIFLESQYKAFRDYDLIIRKDKEKIETYFA